MATREYREVYRPHPGWSGALPVAGFVVALAAAALQTAWWFSHGWTWSNLVRFLASGQPVTWCVILILVGASLSWAGIHNVRGGKEGNEARTEHAGSWASRWRRPSLPTPETGARCQVPGARCQMPDARCQVPDARC